MAHRQKAAARTHIRGARPKENLVNALLEERATGRGEQSREAAFFTNERKSRWDAPAEMPGRNSRSRERRRRKAAARTPAHATGKQEGGFDRALLEERARREG